MGVWARHYDKCRGCHSTQRPHKGHGFCTRCYRVTKRIDLLRGSTPTRLLSSDVPRFLYSGDDPDRRAAAEERWHRRRSARIRYLQEVILHWRQVERFRNGPVSGLDLEYELRRVAARSERSDIFFGLATTLSHEFSGDQRVLLYRLLSRIGENDDVKLGEYRLHQLEENDSDVQLPDDSLFDSNGDSNLDRR